jgi:hypothetical protein
LNGDHLCTCAPKRCPFTLWVRWHWARSDAPHTAGSVHTRQGCKRANATGVPAARWGGRWARGSPHRWGSCSPRCCRHRRVCLRACRARATAVALTCMPVPPSSRRGAGGAMLQQQCYPARAPCQQHASPGADAQTAAGLPAQQQQQQQQQQQCARMRSSRRPASAQPAACAATASARIKRGVHGAAAAAISSSRRRRLLWRRRQQVAQSPRQRRHTQPQQQQHGSGGWRRRPTAAAAAAAAAAGIFSGCRPAAAV